MIVDTNTEHISKTEHVEFVNYTGSFPNLCRGVLTLKIDGEIVKEYYSHLGEWEISLNELPEQYRQYAREIDVVFNSCVRHGCCGGCS